MGQRTGPSVWLVVTLAACGGGKPAVTEPVVTTPDAGPPPMPTAAQRALAEHRERLLDHVGVADVVVADDGNGLVVRLCAAEAATGLWLGGLGVPATTATGDWKQTARGEDCGCVREGKYLRDGAPYAVACTTCQCNRPCTVVAGCDDLHHHRDPPPPVFFRSGTVKLAASADLALGLLRERLAAEDAELVKLHQGAVTALAIHGHASKREKNPDELSEQRAEVVRDLLVKQGLERARIVLVDGLGTSADARPIVTFEIRRPAPKPRDPEQRDSPTRGR